MPGGTAPATRAAASSDAPVGIPTSGAPAAAGDAAGRGEPDPQPGEATGARPNDDAGQPSGRGAADRGVREEGGDAGQDLLGVAMAGLPRVGGEERPVSAPRATIARDVAVSMARNGALMRLPPAGARDARRWPAG